MCLPFNFCLVDLNTQMFLGIEMQTCVDARLKHRCKIPSHREQIVSAHGHRFFLPMLAGARSSALAHIGWTPYKRTHLGGPGKPWPALIAYLQHGLQSLLPQFCHLRLHEWQQAGYVIQG